MKILDSVVPEMGYCCECDRPRAVVGFKVKEWPYRIQLCKECLETELMKKFNLIGNPQQKETKDGKGA